MVLEKLDIDALDYCNNINLKDKRGLTEQEANRILFGAACGLEYLHHRLIVHLCVSQTMIKLVPCDDGQSRDVCYCEGTSSPRTSC
jgi:serine/threonine protein kinase